MAIRSSASRSQFKGSARSTGFKPIEISGQNIERMREQSARVVENMRAVRNAEIQNRQQQANAMREDAAAQRSALKQNQSIAEGNVNRKLQGLKLEAQTQAEQFVQNQEDSAKIFKGLADLSSTASEKFRELEQQKADEQAQQAYNNYDPNSDAVIQQIFGEGELAAMSEQREQALDELEGKADPLAIKQARSMNSYQQYGVNKARADYLLTEVYEQKLAKVYSENPDLGNDAAGTAAFLSTFKRNFLRETGILTNYKPEMVRYGLSRINKLHQSYQGRARQKQADFEDGMALERTNTMLSPQDFSANILSAFRTRSRIEGYTKALDWVESLATVRNAKGEFMYSIDQLASMDLKGSGKPFSQEWEGRWGSMLEARQRSDLSARQLDIQTSNAAYQKDLTRIMEGLTANPTKANYEEAAEFFRRSYPDRPQPQVLKKFGESYTNEAIDREKQIERIEEIPIGFITQEDVDALLGLDFAAGQRLNQKYALQEQRYNSGTFKDTADSFKSIANGVTTFGTNKPNSPASILLQGKMRAEYRRRVDEAVAGGADFNTAASQIGQQLSAEVQAGFRDQQSPWYRKIDPTTQQATFPNLSKNQASAVEAANKKYAALKKSIADKGISKVLTTPESIITRVEAEQLVASYGTASFTVPSDVMAVAAMSNGGDPFVIINAQLEALGMSPLPPPPSMQATEEASPAFKALLYKTPSPARSTRALGAGVGAFRPELVKGGYGEFVLQSATTHGVAPNLIAALLEIESGGDPGAVSKTGAGGLMQIQPEAHPNYTGGHDPQANIDYGTQYYAQLLQKYGDPVQAAGAYNAGPGRFDEYLQNGRPLPQETVDHMRRFSNAMYKYGGGTQALNHPSNMRFNFRQLVTGNPGIQSSADGARVYDPDGHGGANYHDHFELGSVEEVADMVDLLMSTNDPWTGKPYNVTSTLRRGDKGAHGAGRAIDVAPPLNLPPEEEQAWSEHLYKVIGLNPNSIR